MKFKELLDNALDKIGKAILALVFIAGMLFIVEQGSVLVQNAQAETPKIKETTGICTRYERVYAYGKYYLVFENFSGGDIEVIPLD